MTGGEIHLGYEIGTGKAVTIPLRHMVVTGQTQEAGKTTTLEGLISRAGVPAVAFVTKRGEQSFAHGRRIAPYFRERADWQFVASVLEAAMRERLKFERAWIMRASKGARTLADVHRNVKEAMKTAKGLSADIYLQLDSYLDIVVPRVAAVQFAPTLDLQDGLNVLDLSNRDRFPPELQSLVMRSVLEWIYERGMGAITIIPEAWEFIPEGRGSPVKLSAIELIRKGAGLKNYVWLDSQDIGGVDKQLLRSCPVWLLGVQREANEVKRVLGNIPAGVAKPKAADVQRLKKGEFYACYGEHVVKTYVQPEWMEPSHALDIALGRRAVNHFKPPAPTEESPMSAGVEQKLDTLIELMSRQHQPVAASARETAAERPTPADAPRAAISAAPVSTDEEAMYERFKARLISDLPGDARVLQIITSKPELTVEVRKHVIEVDGDTLRGRIAILISAAFFDTAQTSSTVISELAKKGFTTAGAHVARELGELTKMGFLTRDNKWFRSVADMKVNIIEA